MSNPDSENPYPEPAKDKPLFSSRMEDVEVYVSEGCDVVISQGSDFLEDRRLIALHPDQVEIVISWMRAAKDRAWQIVKDDR